MQDGAEQRTNRQCESTKRRRNAWLCLWFKIEQYLNYTWGPFMTPSFPAFDARTPCSQLFVAHFHDLQVEGLFHY
jgi:hypothetical protein